MQTLATYVIMTQNEVDDTSQRAKNVIERAVKDTYQEIVRFTFDTLVGTTEEDVTATVDQRYIETVGAYQDIKEVLWKNTSATSYVTLKRSTEEDYYNDNVNTDSGEPGSFYLVGDKIYFNIAPSTAGTVKVAGVIVTPELTADSIIPDRFNSVLVQGSIARFKAYEGLPDANEYFNYYRGPYFEQGKIGGQLMNMIEELSTKSPARTIKLFGK